MITSYFDFFYSIFEDKETDLAESFIYKIYKGKALSALKEKSKLKKLEENPEISDTDLKNYLNKEVKLSEKEDKEVKEISLLDPYYIRIKKILKDKKEWFPLFLQFFFLHFKNSMPNSDKDYNKISGLLGEYTVNSKTNYLDGIVLDKLSFGRNTGSFGSIIEEMLAMNKETISKLLTKLQEIFKLQKIQNLDLSRYTGDNFKQLVKDILPKEKLDTEEEIESAKRLLSTPTYSRPGYEMLSDFITSYKRADDIEFIVRRLPKGVVNKENPEYNRQNLYEEYNKLSDNDKLTTDSEYTKSDLNKLLGELVELFIKKKVPLKVDRSGEEKKYPYEDIFKLKEAKGEDKQVDKNLNMFYERLQNALNTFSNENVSSLVDDVLEANRKFGLDSVNIIYQEGKKVVLNITNYEANYFLHNKQYGKRLTQHCLAYGIGHWNGLVGDNNKLYYIYNFGLDSNLSNLLPFGVIIRPDGKVSSAVDKLDQDGKGNRGYMTQNQVEDYMRDFEIPYSVLAPMSEEELEERKAKTSAIDILRSANPSIKLLEKALKTGIDPNSANCQAMINAINNNDLEKINLLVKYGARVNGLGVNRESGLKYTKNLNILKRLIELGEDINYKNGEILLTAIEANNLDMINFLLDNGISLEKLGGNKKIDPLEVVNTAYAVYPFLKRGLPVKTVGAEDNIFDKLMPDNFDNNFIKVSAEILEILVKNPERNLSDRVFDVFEWSLEHKLYDYSVYLMLLIATNYKGILFKRLIQATINYLKSMDKNTFIQHDLLKSFIHKLKEKEIKLEPDNRSYLISIIDGDYKAIKAKNK
jgi:hypothetical protein